MSSRLRELRQLSKKQDVILNIVCMAFAVGFVAMAFVNVLKAGDFLTIDALFLTAVSLLLAGVFMISPLYWMYTNGMLRNPFDIEESETAATASHAVHFEGTNKLFLTVWGGLLILTGVEVFLGYIHLSIHLMLTILIGLSLIKAAMIVAYFMHLRFERLSLFLTLIPMLVICICLFFIFFPDGLRARNLRYQGPQVPAVGGEK
jgi:cytochrome c oxidase subunit 4